MTSATPASSKNRGFVRQSTTSSITALVALLSGLLLDVVFAARFGAGTRSDAFFAAARIPIGLTAVLTSVASVAWVPLFTRDRRANGQASLNRFASRLLTTVALAGMALWGLASVFAHPLMRLTAPGLNATQLDLAASIVPLMFLLVPLVAAAEAVRSAMNASYSFVLAASMNFFMNSVAAALVFMIHNHDVRAVARAYVIGAIVQLVVITVIAWAQGTRVRMSLRIADSRVKQAVGLSGRPTVSSVLNLANRTAEQALASFLPSGSITILSYSQRLIAAVGGGIFFRPIVVALLPRLADAEHAGDRAEAAALVRRALRVTLAITLPLTVFTIALAGPAIRLVFFRGNFSPHATHLLAITFAVYSASLAASGIQRVLLAPFYARLDTRTPLRNTFYGVVVDLALIVPCVAIWGFHSRNALLGIAIAYSLTQYFIVWHAWSRLRPSMPLHLRSLTSFVVRAVSASVASMVAMLALVWALNLTHLTDRLRLFLLTAGVAAVGACCLGGLTVVGMYLTSEGHPMRRRHIGRHRHDETPESA